MRKSYQPNNELFHRLFEQIFEKDPEGFCSKADLQMYIVKNEKDALIKTLGFDITNLHYCKNYRLFSKYIRSIVGVEDKIVRLGDKCFKAFKGIKLKMLI